MAMGSRDSTILRNADMALEALGMNQAALDGDFDEARFRARRLVTAAFAVREMPLASAAARVCHALGPMGSEPQPWLGIRLLQLVEALDAVSSPPK